MKKLITLNIQYYESVVTKATLIQPTEISRGIFLDVRAMLDDNAQWGSALVVRGQIC